MIVPLSFTMIHACNSSSAEEKITPSIAPLSLYLRIPSENAKKSVELSELQVPASGLGMEIFGFEDKRVDVRLRDVVVESSRCSVVATASVVIVGGGFGLSKTARQAGVQRTRSRASGIAPPANTVLFVTNGQSQRYLYLSLMAALAT